MQLLLSLLSLLLLSLTPSPVSAKKPHCTTWGWATFYDDNACKTNPSVAYSLNNHACVENEPNRGSIYIQAACYGEAALVFSPEMTCDCQTHCEVVPTKKSQTFQDQCWDISGMNRSSSAFRFIQRKCDENNC